MIYSKKIKTCKDLRLAEFNYKVLHFILPCLDNLKKWKIVDNNLWPLYQVKHDVIHLLYFCKKAKAVWANINVKFNSHLTLYSVFGLCEENNLSNVFIHLLHSVFIKNGYVFIKMLMNGPKVILSVL